MLIIRPITERDYPALLSIAQESGIGFTSLPVNEELLRKKIAAANAAFASKPEKPGLQSYLFVMEDTDTGEVVGTSGIEATVGLHDAFYHYHVGKVVHASRELGVHNTVEILTFCNDYTGVSEICTLFLKESARKGQAGRLLSKFRFLFMAQHRQRFSNTVIAEMRGVSDEAGRIGNKVFIAELMPKYPIYVNLLSREAQACIGNVHEKTRPALRLLEQEGFRNRGYVDIFDAGPTVEADLSNISTVRNSKALHITVDNSPHFADASQYFVINDKIEGFRACVAPVVVRASNDALISSEVAAALQIESGSKVRIAPCTPTLFP